MRKVHSPSNEIELAIIRSILDGEDIPYLVENDHFGSMLPGPITYRYNAKSILVDDDHYELAKEVIASYLKDID